MPCQIDRGLKCYGHPIGASGLRMLYAMYEQLATDRSSKLPEERKIKNARMGLTHNLGGTPHANIAAVAVIGKD